MFCNIWSNPDLLESFQKSFVALGVLLPFILVLLDLYYERKKKLKLFIALSIATFGVITFVIDSRLNHFRNIKEGKLNLAISNANNEAYRLKLKLANADIRLAQIRDIAESADSSSKKLQTRFSWRTLSEKKIGNFISRLSKFKGKSITISKITTSPENVALATQIASIFEKAGLRVDWRRQGVVVTVMVGIEPNNGDFSLKFGKNRYLLASEVRRILCDAGLKEATFNGDGIEPSDDEILLNVLLKEDRS